jgi:hypothetical protein
MRDIVSFSSGSYTTYDQDTPPGLTDLLAFPLGDLGFRPAFLLGQRFSRNTILTLRPKT